MEMEDQVLQQTQQPQQTQMQQTVIKPVGADRLREFVQILQKYKTGKANTDQRIIATENWWKLRNTMEEQKETNIGKDGGFVSRSGWLHNVIVSKHADAMDSFPEPIILPREESDREEASRLSAIIPCVLEQNQFEKTYSDANWRKMKSGTGVYKVTWDKNLLNGLGDIRVENVSVLNLFWEPGVTDIQKSRYFFQTELWDKELLEQKYPELKDKLKGNSFVTAKFLYDDTVSTENKATVIDVYYHVYQGKKKVLHYCKFVGDTVLFATENETQIQPDMMGRPTEPMAVKGLYDHGLYPYVFDSLFPIEGSPCGYGYVDLCKNPQTEIDLMKTSFVKNAMVGSVPRYMAREDSKINEEDFLDLSNPLIRVAGNIDETAMRRIEHNSLDGAYLNLLDRDIQELRETSGNTETSTGNIQSGVTAASAIAALQEASGKSSRDSTQNSYRSHGQIVNLCIELIRQFYVMPRQFRILGEYGAEKYITYTNAGIRPQHQGTAFGQDLGYRLPVFDIKISAQRKNAYTKVSQNELALQLFKMGIFNPQMADQAMMCLELMEFEGKESLMQKVSRNGMMIQKLAQYMQMALSFAQVVQPEMVQVIAQDMAQTLGEAFAAPQVGAPGSMPRLNGGNAAERGQVRNARYRANHAAQPTGEKQEE